MARMVLLGTCPVLVVVVMVSYGLLGPAIAINPSENEVDPLETHPINPKSPASILPAEVDILRLMNVSAKDQGVSLVEGPIPNYHAYKFRLPYFNVPLANSTSVTQTLRAPNGFTTVFLYRQQKNNLGTLISVHSPGRLTPWFQITSNSKMGVLGLKYRTDKSPKLRQMEWELPKHHRKSPLAAWTWVSVSMDFVTGIVRLDLDCQPSRFESLTPGNDPGHISVPQDSLVYFRQEPGRKKKFLGSMQVAKVLPYVTQKRPWNCVEISTNPAPQFRKPIV